MRTSPRWLPFAIALPLTVLFTALGVWQIQRLGDRRAANEAFSARFTQPPLTLRPNAGEGAVTAADVSGRRVRVDGRWAPEGELVVRGQAWLGTPGVTVLTPLLTDSANAVLVQRGWLPAADGVAANLAAAGVREKTGRVSVQGLALAGQSPSGLPVREGAYPDRTRPVLGTIDIAAADSILPWSLAPFYIQLLPDTAADARPRGNAPLPLPPPPLTDGPHALYAFQWFGFALIALAGAFLLPKAGRRASVGPAPPERPTNDQISAARRGPPSGNGVQR